jgi:hypothetical protein
MPSGSAGVIHRAADFVARLPYRHGVTPREVYDELVDGFLSRPGVALGRSLSNETLTVGGKIFAFCKGDQLVVKLPRSDVVGLLDAGQGEAFTAGGRTMREWVAVPWTTRETWQSLMQQAYAYVGQ